MKRLGRRPCPTNLRSEGQRTKQVGNESLQGGRSVWLRDQGRSQYNLQQRLQSPPKLSQPRDLRSQRSEYDIVGSWAFVPSFLNFPFQLYFAWVYLSPLGSS
ncbi:hypothetical protein FXO38_18479 [Capsicum annuum]|nr:hypothetical protein FXO38_18479 [Capsicum annuum]